MKQWLTLAFLFSLNGATDADQFIWQGTDGDFDDATNWFDNTLGVPATTVPGSSDIVGFFDYSGGGTYIGFSSNRENDIAQIYNRTLKLGGNTYNLVSYFESLGGTVENGTLSTPSLQLTDLGTSASTIFTDLIVTGDSLDVQTNSSLSTTGSTIHVDNFYLGSSGATTSTSTLLNSSDLTAKYGYFYGGSLSIDGNSTASFDGDGPPDYYATSLDTRNAQIEISGTLTTIGATIATYQPGSSSTSIDITPTGAWNDTSESRVAIGVGGNAVLNIDGGTANISILRLAEIGLRYDFSTEIIGSFPVDSTGEINISNGGLLTSDSVEMGAVRWVLDGGTSVSSLNLATFSTAQIGQLTALGSSFPDPNVASIEVTTGATLDASFLRGGAPNLELNSKVASFNLSVNSGGNFISDYTQLIGDSNGGLTTNVSADFASAALVDIKEFSIYSGAKAQFNDVTATLGKVTAGGTLLGGGGAITIKNSDVQISNGTPGSFLSWTAELGTLQVEDTNLTIQNGSRVEFRSGSFNGSSGSLSFLNTDFQGEGSLVAQSGSLSIESSNFKLENGASTSIIVVGDTHTASASIENSAVEASRFRSGFLTGGNADIVLRDSSISASTTLITPTSPGSIIIGRDGASQVELFNSDLNGHVIYIGAQGILKGDGTLNGNPLGNLGTDVLNHGLISPGHSPGQLVIDGDLSNFGILELEIDLSNPFQYDSIIATGTINLGGTLQLKAIGTGTFDPSAAYTLLGASNFTGGFANYEIDPALGIDSSSFSFANGAFGINPIPEPSILTLSAVGAFALLSRRRTS